MNITYIKEVCTTMSAFMNEHGFSDKEQDTGIYKGESKIYKVAYDSENKKFSISSALLDVDGDAMEYSLLSSWFFDEDDHGANDTKCIAEDFISTVANDNGIKIVTTAEGNPSEVALPEKAEQGTDPGIEAFTQKFLAMFPQYKDSYKALVAKYGEFLYVEFFKTYAVEKMCELMENESGNKKALTKYWHMLGDMHYEGEQIVGDIICAVIIAGSFGNCPEKFTAAAEKYLADYPFLKTSGAAAITNYKTDKKLRNVLKA